MTVSLKNYQLIAGNISGLLLKRSVTSRSLVTLTIETASLSDDSNYTCVFEISGFRNFTATSFLDVFTVKKMKLGLI